ncbi:histone-like nucleoid-structuring protein Lsr2, partial [Dermatophilus congolensis]
EEVVSFGLDGVQYEIDLSKENAEKLRASLQEWVEKARRAGGRRVAGRRASGSGSGSGRRNDLNEIRQWGRENGFKVSDRGRVSREVEEAYDRAHN